MKNNLPTFTLTCLPLRIGLTIASALLSDHREFRILVGILAILVSLGLLRAYGNPIGFFGNPRYWPSTLHAILYAIFAAMILSDSAYGKAWIVLAFDIVIGTLVVSHAYS